MTDPSLAQGAVHLAPDLARARRDGRPIVALESSVFAHGLPDPWNREAAARMRAAVESTGAVAGITAVVRGTPAVGLTDEELERFLAGREIAKASARDLPVAMAGGVDAATTVAASLAICRALRLPVLATGGIGGVHREPAYDESADLIELSRTSMVVVCSGAKSILDLPATLERLETLGVTVVGSGTAEFPGFLFASTGIPLGAVAEDVAHVARIHLRQRQLGLPGALLLVQAPPAALAMSRELVEAAVADGLDETRRAGIRGAASTPYLLSAIDRATDGASRRANLALLEANARLAGDVAVALLQAGVG
jgi:pseudouridine-5'-phosphate glycosidase